MNSRGEIFTFYSYKGGVGRSMSLANMAWLLASNGKRVLAIDWDLEAPGLPRFFRPFIDNRSLASSSGLIDLLVDQKEMTFHPPTILPSLQANTKTSRDVHWHQYVLPIKWKFPNDGSLEIMPSGKPGPSYAQRVTRFDWAEFYSHFHGAEIIEQLKIDLRNYYDYVLVDSRTGINDSSGICTIQMPDKLIICTTLNRQSIEGSATVAESAETQRRNRGSQAELRIFPIATRVELSEKAKLDLARQHIESKFSRFLWHLPQDHVQEYWGSTEIRYTPFYAYEEILCTFGDVPGTFYSMLASIERITAYLTGGEVKHLPPIDDLQRRKVLNMFSRVMPESSAEITCFISYSSKDDAFASKLYADLENAGIKCWFAPHDLPFGAKIRAGIDEAILTHNKVVLILSNNSISSTWVEKEVETAFEKEIASGSTILIPIRLDSTVMETKASWAADIRRQRNIGNFSSWQDTEFYEESFKRLLESLKV
jgi:hypothetical protein